MTLLMSKFFLFLKSLDLKLYFFSFLLLLFRSDIHGRGLFCKRNIEAGEMVIEYAGTVIRAVLTDKRQKFYDSKVSNHNTESCSEKKIIVQVCSCCI